VNESAPKARHPFWKHRWPWLLLLLAIAAVYFGSYYRHGINFRDEGGTLTLLGQRVLAGDVPFREVELGYNVGWFLPIAGLFAITGVDFVALRVFFMALSTLAAVLGFLTVVRAARHAGWDRAALPLGLLTGVLLIVTPGMMFKNYNPLAVVANSWCLLGFVLAGGVRESAWRAALGGVVLGATWLVRIDLGTFFTLLWLGTLVCRTIGLPGTLKERGATFVLSLILLALGIAATHAPVLWDAYRRDYAKQFLGAYPNHWNRFVSKVPGLAQRPAAEPKKALPTPAPTAEGAAPAPAAPTPAAERAGAWKNETLSRTSWADVQQAGDKQKEAILGLFLLTYIPPLVLLALTLWAGVRWLMAVARGMDSTTPLAALVLIGGSLTMFPQFFFWRPDAPHLSEFGPGYWVAVFGALALLGAGTSWRSPARWFGIFLTVNVALWLWRMLPDRWCGTIAARENRKVLFEGENGVRVYEQKKTVEWMNQALALIQKHSGPDDYLVAYPYHPSFNVLANRRTYEKNVYIDNAEAKAGWSKAAIARIEKFRPAIIVVSDWDINGTDASRFRNWAAEAYRHIQANYELVGTFDPKEKFEIYVRKGEAASNPPPQ
jgi:hypothetical protein